MPLVSKRPQPYRKLNLFSKIGWAGHVLAVVASRIAKSGIEFAISAGNDGGLGMFYGSSPATGVDATAVGAVSNTKFPILVPTGSYSTANSTSTNFSMLLGTPSFASAVKLPVWSAVDLNNACTPLPNGTDLSETIVLLQLLDARTTKCYSQDQSSNIAEKGGRYMLYYDGSGSNLYVTFRARTLQEQEHTEVSNNQQDHEGRSSHLY